MFCLLNLIIGGHKVRWFLSLGFGAIVEVYIVASVVAEFQFGLSPCGLWVKILIVIEIRLFCILNLIIRGN